MNAMKPLLTVLVAYGSWHIGGRVVQRLSTLPDVAVVAGARAADEAIAQATAARPDLVIVDMVLAQGDGLDVLRALKRGAAPPAVIVTSSERYPRMRKECLREGADHFFTLPDDVDALCFAVSSLARGVQQAEGGGRA